jgi:cation diffusion facilitator CzcD-associated flavoprotein CzcO
MPGLTDLERHIARDLELVAHPRAKWLRPRTAQGSKVLDVLVVGAGQCGLATAFALLRDQVDNIQVIDRAAYGQEGPWVTYARMPTLRSWKNQTGPDLNIPSLTYQSWHEAQFGAEDFAALRWIAASRWQDYLLWFRRVTKLPVRNEVALAALHPACTDDGLPCLRATLQTRAGSEICYARKIVLATGQDGAGRWWMPPFIATLPEEFRAHTCEDIDFDRLRGKRVAVLGAGASAFDNAATALEYGAQVDLYCRRAEPMVIQPYRWLTFAGFLKHMGDMPDEWRWRFMQYIMGLREGFPADTYARVNRFDRFAMHVGQPWTDAAVVDGRLCLQTPAGPVMADYAICGTGVWHDFAARPELAAFADNIARWADRYTPPEAERSDRLGAFPYLAPDYAFEEREPGRSPWIRDIHYFGMGTAMSFGPAGSSINAMTTAVPKLVYGITKGLFRADLGEHWESLQAYNEPQVILG